MSEHREQAGPGLNIPGDIVYVREVRPEELPEEARASVPAGKIYGIHDPTGARLALTADRQLAFSLARQHDRRPVSVH